MTSETFTAKVHGYNFTVTVSDPMGSEHDYEPRKIIRIAGVGRWDTGRLTGSGQVYMNHLAGLNRTIEQALREHGY